MKDIKLDGKTLTLRKFKLDWMVPNPSIAMIAKRGSGKSYVTRDILRHFHSIPVGAVISPTDKMSSFYGDFFPDCYIHYQYDAVIIEKILYRQTEMIEINRGLKKIGKKIDTRAFLVMDDCLSSKGSWMKDEPILEMFFNGRHYHVMYILTMQFPLGITPELRSNFDYIFLLAEDFISNQKRLFEHYAGMFPNFEAFKSIFSQITKDYGCMVIVNRGSKNSFTDKVFWYVADDISIDNMGCKQFREFHKNNFNENWRRKRKPFNINDFCSKRKKNIHIDVSKIDTTKLN